MSESAAHRFTVAIPTYNGSKFIAQAIRSVFGQLERDFEILICDDRSIDETIEIVRGEAGDRARIEVNSERLGLAGNWNRCLERCRSRLIAIFHQDDLMHPEHLRIHRRAFEQADVGMVSSGSWVIDERGNSVPRSIVDPGGLGASPLKLGDDATSLERVLGGNPFRCSATSLDAEKARMIGGFDARYRYVVDWEFWVRMIRNRGAIWTPETTVAVRWHLGSETHRFRDGTADIEETLTVARNLGGGDPRFAEPLRVAERTSARAYLNRAYLAAKAGRRGLGRSCLRRAIKLDPRLLAKPVLDPRLLARLLSLVIPRDAESAGLIDSKASS